MSFPRVLFVLRERDNPYGSDTPGDKWCDTPGEKHLSSGLFNSAKFVSDMLVTLGFASKVVHVADNNAIHKEVVAFRPNIAVIESLWVIPSKFDELKIASPNVTFVVRSHSDIPFMASEGNAIGWIKAYLSKSNVIVATNSHRALSDLKLIASENGRHENPTGRHYNPIAYLPNFYPTAGALLTHRPPGNPLRIGCFGAIRPLKNQLTQAVAALRFGKASGKDVHFHINGSRIEHNGSAILKNLIALFDNSPGNMLVMHPWLPHSDFMTLTKQMDVVTQVSFSETFSIVTADAVVSGVPVVVSDQITWIAKAHQASCDDSAQIAAVMASVVNTTNLSNLFSLGQYDSDSVISWLRFLSQF